MIHIESLYEIDGQISTAVKCFLSKQIYSQDVKSNTKALLFSTKPEGNFAFQVYI